MHDGCHGSFISGEQVVDKLRMMGFSRHQMPIPVTLVCSGCEQSFVMETLECRCPHCNMVYGVTPCHAHDSKSIQPAGVNY